MRTILVVDVTQTSFGTLVAGTISINGKETKLNEDILETTLYDLITDDLDDDEDYTLNVDPDPISDEKAAEIDEWLLPEISDQPDIEFPDQPITQAEIEDTDDFSSD